MDKKDKQSARNTRDISTQLQEENLWDLEDDWSDDEDAPIADENEAVTEPEEDDLVLETELDLAEDTSDQPEVVLEEPALKPPAPPVETVNKPYAELATADEALEEDNVDDELSEDPSKDLPEDSTEASLGSIAAPATVALNRLSLSPTEKIALSALAAVLVGLAIWGCIWLSGKNQIANTRETIDLPVGGKHATVTGLETFWITPEKGPGVNLNAVVVPSVTITLDEDKSSDGALRLFFRNTSGDSIGDPITLPFKSGQFSNGSNTIEMAASDGFHEEGQFHAYQVDDATPWRIQILEAPSAASSGSDFMDLIDAPVAAKRR